MSSSAFIWMESVMDYVIWWLMAFLPIIIAKILYLKHKGVYKSADSMFFTEAIGLPVTFLQPIVFFKALFSFDWLGMAITAWWGPGFLSVVFLVLWSKYIAKKKINWGNSGVVISWLCKIYYLLYFALALLWDMPKLIFAISAWIASDQIEKTFASLDADRTRRTFHDFWLIRLLYPLMLFLPWIYDLPLYMKLYGVLVFLVWAWGIVYVARKKEFFNMPDDPTLLRNMTYFKKD